MSLPERPTVLEAGLKGSREVWCQDGMGHEE